MYHPPFFVLTRCLSQKPSLARTSLVRVLTQTTREYNPYAAVNYIYLILSSGLFEDNHFGDEDIFIRHKFNLLFEMRVLKLEIN